MNFRALQQTGQKSLINKPVLSIHHQIFAIDLVHLAGIAPFMQEEKL
jgi:hypothetical protein